MIKTVVHVEGMMCHNCEKHVNEAVKKNFKVKSVESSFERQETVILSKAALDPDALKTVIGEEGYQPGEVEVSED